MMKSNKPKKALQRRGKSFLFAARGIGFAVKTQPNFCFHLLAILLVTEFGLLFYGLEKERWGLVLVFFCLIPALELVNTALEAVVHMVSPNYHPLAKVAKDCAAGAVLVAALGAVAAGGVPFRGRYPAEHRLGRVCHHPLDVVLAGGPTHRSGGDSAASRQTVGARRPLFPKTKI